MRLVVNTIALISCGQKSSLNYIDVRYNSKTIELLKLLEFYGIILYFICLDSKFCRIFFRQRSDRVRFELEIYYRKGFSSPKVYKKQILKFLIGQYWLINNKGRLQIVSPKLYKDGHLIAKIY